eukprot:1214271-Pleurochrysis_carterae.AAC.1
MQLTVSAISAGIMAYKDGQEKTTRSSQPPDRCDSARCHSGPSTCKTHVPITALTRLLERQGYGSAASNLNTACTVRKTRRIPSLVLSTAVERSGEHEEQRSCAHTNDGEQERCGQMVASKWPAITSRTKSVPSRERQTVITRKQIGNVHVSTTWQCRLALSAAR